LNCKTYDRYQASLSPRADDAPIGVRAREASALEE
jgi:hypothetical protein